MSIKDQWRKIKDNWLILVIILVLLVFFNFNGDSLSRSLDYSISGAKLGYAESGIAMPSSDFAPEVEDRLLTKSASLSTEVGRGEFMTSEKTLKDIITSSSSYLLNENVNRYEGERGYYWGYYQIKVASSKYDSVVSQLKSIGEVQSFSENTQDITGQYTNTQINLEIEKSRLDRYKGLYSEATSLSDKLKVSDLLYTQERRVKYLEDSLKNTGQTVQYSTVYFTMTEKRSEYVNIVLVKFSALVKSLVGSINKLLTWTFVLLPWILVVLIAGFIWKKFRKRS